MYLTLIQISQMHFVHTDYGSSVKTLTLVSQVSCERPILTESGKVRGTTYNTMTLHDAVLSVLNCH